MRTDTPDELLVTGGRVHVLDDDRTTAGAVLFRGDRVAAVGDPDDVAAAADDPERIDLDGRTVLPGFNDAHTHLLSIGIQEIETDLSGADDRETALDRLATNAERTADGDWVLGYGYDESTWPAGERSYLSRAELDAVSGSHPVAAVRVDGHTVSLNSRALEAVDFEGVEEDVVREDGEPTGRVVEDAAGRVRIAAAPDDEKARRALDAAVDRMHELGITSVATMAGLTAVRERGNATQAALHAANREGDLDLRVTYYVHASQAASLSDLELASGFGDEYLRVGGLKTFSDGSLGARTAKIHGEYRPEEGTEDGEASEDANALADGGAEDGQMVHDGDRLESWYREAARADQQIATHAIGGVAIDEVLDRYDAVREEYGDVDPRLRIEHVELATDEALDRMAEAGVVASVQPNFLQWSSPGGLYEDRLGSDALPANNRYREMLDRGVPLAFGSDKMPPGPLYGMHLAVNADYASQRVTVDEALAAYTRGPAYAEFAEEEKGTLEPGMFGDAVVLDRDPYDHPGELRDLSVEATVLGGEVVHRTF